MPCRYINLLLCRDGKIKLQLTFLMTPCCEPPGLHELNIYLSYNDINYSKGGYSKIFKTFKYFMAMCKIGIYSVTIMYKNEKNHMIIISNWASVKCNISFRKKSTITADTLKQYNST
jgi:hypothetical protein